MSILTQDQIDIAVKFWTMMFKVPAMRQPFGAALRRILQNITEEERRSTFVHELAVDYDPSPLLIRALEAVGIVCRGFMFSADGLFPYKTRSWLNTDGTVGISLGYGDGPVEISTLAEFDALMLERIRV